MKKVLLTIGVTAVLSITSIVAAQAYTFNTDLGIGSSGQDVASLQTWLITRGYHIVAIENGLTAKGYFGVQTKNAVAAFQTANGINPSGFVGPATRAKLNSAPISGSQGSQVINQNNQGNYGGWNINPIPTYGAPSINGIDAPTSLTAGQTGTWTVRASDPRNGLLSYSVDWGESSCPAGYVCSASAPISSVVRQTSTFTHSYVNPGTYTVRFTVRNDSGLSAQTTSTVTVTAIGGGGTAGSLRITSPNGGEIWTVGSLQTIRWTSPYYFRATTADIKAIRDYNCSSGSVCPAIAYAPYLIATGVNINQNSYSWNAGQVLPSIGGVTTTVLPAGQYRIQICELGGTNCDLSDQVFTLSSSQGSGVVPDINIISPNGAGIWSIGTTQAVTVNVTGDPARVGSQVYTYLIDSYGAQTPLQGYIQLSPSGPGVKTFNVFIPSTIRPGTYRLMVSLFSSVYGGTPTMQAYDYSDGYFTVSDSSVYQYYGNPSTCPAGYSCTPVR